MAINLDTACLYAQNSISNTHRVYNIIYYYYYILSNYLFERSPYHALLTQIYPEFVFKTEKYISNKENKSQFKMFKNKKNREKDNSKINIDTTHFSCI